MSMENQLSNSVQNRFLIKEYRKRIKELIRKDPDNKEPLLIALFVLFVAELEFRLKQCIAYMDGVENYQKNMENIERKHLTLGPILEEFKDKMKEYVNKQKIEDFKLKEIFKPEFITDFYCKCREIKKIRNDLFHNLFSLDVEQPAIKAVLEKIEKRINVEYDDFFFEQKWNHSFNEIINSITSPFQDNWTLEILLLLLDKYLRRIMNLNPPRVITTEYTENKDDLRRKSSRP